MADPDPKLRVIDDEAKKPVEVLRLRPEGTSFEPVQRLPGPSSREVPERLELPQRELFDGRSQEPGVEAILDQEEIVENVEQRWGSGDGRLAGIPYGWFVLITVFLVTAGVWSIRKMYYGEKGVEMSHELVRERVVQDEARTQSAADLVDRVEEVVAGYLAADTVDKILPWVRHPERVKPLIEDEWNRHPRPALAFTRMSIFEARTIDDKPFWVVRAEVRDGKPQNLLVEQLGETDARVDWETHVCYQPMDWDRYVAERPTDEALEFRVWAARDTTHFSHEFSDSGRWNCYHLTANGSDGFLLGYVEAGSEAAQILEGQCAASPNQMAAVIVRLRIPQGTASPHGVVIEKVIEPRWLRVEDPSNNAP